MGYNISNNTKGVIDLGRPNPYKPYVDNANDADSDSDEPENDNSESAKSCYFHAKTFNGLREGANIGTFYCKNVVMA